MQIRGIPLHVWNENLFKKVGALFGSFLDFDKDIVCKKRYDVANILISTNKMGRIEEWIIIRVMGALFRICVVKGCFKF